MNSFTSTQDVQASVPKVNDDVAVGADIKFQRRWWRFERIAWALLTAYVVFDLLGAFGRGYLAKAHQRTKDGTLDVQYERIERMSAPSILIVGFGNAAIHQGNVQLWVSRSLVTSLGNQRIIPQPVKSVVDTDSFLYTFPATVAPASAQFALTPTTAGPCSLTLRVPGAEELKLEVFVMP